METGEGIMGSLIRLVGGVLVVLSLIGCAGGPMLAEPAVYQSDVSQARLALSAHRLAPSLNLSTHEMQPRLMRVWTEIRPSVLGMCRRVFSHGCEQSVNRMRVVVVADESVNAYADASNFTIGIHAGLLRSAGDDDEIAAVVAHEAAHLLFGHAQKKANNATSGQLMAGALAIAVGAAMRSETILESAGDISMHGWEAGYLAYSPEMELEADQFAMYVLKLADRRLTAGTDIIVRLHRGDVPAPVRRGEGWASYLSTHPANDYRLAAMRSTLNDIREGATRPISQAEIMASHEQLGSRLQNGYIPTVISRSGKCSWIDD